MKTITLGELERQLAECKAHAGAAAADMPVKVWLPGSTISLGAAFLHKHAGAVCIRIEGSVDPGSMLDATQPANSPWAKKG